MLVSQTTLSAAFGSIKIISTLVALPGNITAINLVYFEHTNDIEAAIAREKQIKNWKREWKNELIEKQNPKWIDLSVE